MCNDAASVQTTEAPINKSKFLHVQVVVVDLLGFIHPIEEVQRTLQKLRHERERIAQRMAAGKDRDALLKGLDIAITKHEEMVKKAFGG